MNGLFIFLPLLIKKVPPFPKGLFIMNCQLSIDLIS